MAHTPGENSANGSLDLLGDDEPASIFASPVRHVADTVEASKGRGRPKGSRNRRSADMVAYLQAKGYRDPMETLAAIASADPKQLAAELTTARLNEKGEKKIDAVTAADAMALIVRAAGELMPYYHSKAPTEVHVEEKALGLLLIGEIGTEGPAASEFMSLTGVVIDGEENQ